MGAQVTSLWYAWYVRASAEYSLINFASPFVPFLLVPVVVPGSSDMDLSRLGP